MSDPIESPTPRRDPEDDCHRCGRSLGIPWSAPSPLWNAVMRGGSINGDDEFDGIVCPTCFAQLAEARGIAGLWRFHAERVLVPLETVTPSGRVWDEQMWMWREPEAVERSDLPVGQQSKMVTEEEFRVVAGQLGAQVVVEVLRKVDDRLFALPYTNVGNLPRVEREHLSTAVNETAKEFLGADWVAIMRGEYDWVARVRAQVAEELAGLVESLCPAQVDHAGVHCDYRLAAAGIREHAGKAFPSSPAALPDVVGTPEHQEDRDAR